MPYPPPSRIPAGTRRRSLLASAAGAALLAGCSGSSQDSGSTGGSPSVAEKARARAARDSAGLVERYDAAIAAFPGLAEHLAPLRAEVVRHTEAFGGVRKTTRKASPTAPPSPSAPPSAPADEKDALTGLADAERALSDRRTAALLEVPGELARLMASVAAAGAVHAYLLAEGAR
ncbi:hypothetical protein [Streptomyces sp. CdTB01]|uniref:hypothetical protein n=1 Tax=Streptomyces sp. CdTB01 TaxID=1725411 RepID=UPI00073A9BFF|nr:hypothetical protein [Streptomyces sp. CdTB01]ALV32982.1 hypothetical protein AS200_13645 [Streptomyces sp. CdTB01]